MKNLGMLEYFSCAIYALLIIYFLFLSIRVVRDGRRCRDERRNIIMAGIAAVNAIVLIIYDLSLSDSLSGRLVGAVGLALMPVFLSGLSDRMGKVSTVATAAVAFSVILSFLLRGRAGLWLLPMLSLLSASLVIAESVLFSRNDSPRVYTSSELQVVNIRTNVIYFLVFVLLLMTGAYIGDTDGFASDLSVCLCLVFLILLFNAMYGRMVNHRLFFFLKEYERKLIETADACTFSACEDMSVEDKGYHAIFERLKRLFEEEKPFLDPDINISDVSRSLFTNKAYLSRTINLYTGRNFRQYVNYHRIKYAVSIYHADSSLKVADLAERSGFRTVNSFNMAFRLYLNTTPGEWCRKYKHDSGYAEQK